MAASGGSKADSGELPSGARVAVIGSGLSGLALAASLLQGARARGKSLDVALFGPEVDNAHRPAVLTPECRSRLAALGCRGHLDWKPTRFDAFELNVGGQALQLLPTTSETWILGPGRDGLGAVLRSLAHRVTSQGASFRPWDVDAVESALDHGASPRRDGNIVVRAGGRAERFHAVLLTSGRQSMMADRFFPGYQPPPSVPAVQAVLQLGPSASLREAVSGVVRLFLDPQPGIDGVYLLPARGAVHALAFGPGADARSLCHALMEISFSGALRTGFKLSQVRKSRVPCGISPRLVTEGRMAVGNAAMGHPLQLSISDTLSCCTRAAVSLLEGGGHQTELDRRYVQDGVFDLLHDALAGSRALTWLRRAGTCALAATEAAHRGSASRTSYVSGVWGLATPSPRELLSRARRAGLWNQLRSLFLEADPTEPVANKDPRLVYVVDDDDDVRLAICDYLRERGCHVIAFADELSLFAATRERVPAAIVLDVVLPWVDGLQLCRGLKQHPLTRTTRVVVSSGLDLPYVRYGAREAGADAFLPKPIDLARLWVLVSDSSNSERPGLRQGVHNAAS